MLRISTKEIVPRIRDLGSTLGNRTLQ